METKNSKVIVVFVVMATVLVSSACGMLGQRAKIGEMQTQSESVELDDAQSVDVDVNIGAGELFISGGASKLMEAEFTYNVAELKPEVSYRDGELSVHNPDAATDVSSLWKIGEYKYNWQLQLNDQVPMTLKVNLGAGTADLSLGSLSLTRLELDAGVGEVKIDLTGDWQDDLQADISGGLGELTITLPSSTCVRVSAEGGVGEVEAPGFSRDGSLYVNGACDGSGATLNIDISAGVGQIKLELGE
jgi:hypothetical protein